MHQEDAMSVNKMESIGKKSLSIYLSQMDFEDRVVAKYRVY